MLKFTGCDGLKLSKQLLYIHIYLKDSEETRPTMFCCPNKEEKQFVTDGV